MTRLLLDASVWLAALDRDDQHHTAAKLLLEHNDEPNLAFCALDLTLYEVSNVAIVRWRSKTEAQRLIDLIMLCGTELEQASKELLKQATTIAAKHHLTVYDAAYIAASHRNHSELVSCDLKDLVRPGHAITPRTALELVTR